MAFEDIQTGSVIRYPYLWAREALHGDTEGHKNRPVAVGIRLARPNGDGLILLPITTKQPTSDRWAVEIPDIEKRRAGLEADLQLWLILDEYNEDIVGRSFDLLPEPPLGRFSKAFLLPLMRQLIAKRHEINAIQRL